MDGFPIQSATCAPDHCAPQLSHNRTNGTCSSQHNITGGRRTIPPPESGNKPQNFPLKLRNSATTFWEATTSKIPTKSGKDLDPSHLIGSEHIPGNSGTLETDHWKPNKRGDPNNPPPIIKPSQDWHGSEEELPNQEELALSSPQEGRSTKDPSRENNMVRLLELEDFDDSME